MTDLEAIKRLVDSYQLYADKFLRIRTKQGGVLPLAFNQAQKYIHSIAENQLKETGKVRIVSVKGRQQGVSTYIEGRFFHKVATRLGLKAFILTHEHAATDNLFSMAKMYYEHLPSAIKPEQRYNSGKVLEFAKLNSGYRVGTAGNKATGRSGTIQLFHGSEVAYWPHAYDHAAGVMESLSNSKGTESFLESTANGSSGYFYDQWVAAELGENGYIPVFIPWYWQPEYRVSIPDGFTLTKDEIEIKKQYGLDNEQIYWRRLKIAGYGFDGLHIFRKDYPLTSGEAFQSSDESLIAIDNIESAIRFNADPKGDHIIGVDPARDGKDFTVIIERRGNCAFNLVRRKTPDTMELVGLLKNMLDDRPNAILNMDMGGLGAGIYDRLVELGYKSRVNAVQFQESASNKERYYNVRTEMWYKIAEWLDTRCVQIPKDGTLVRELNAPRIEYKSKGQRLLESKDSIIAKIKASPDAADALALTFYSKPKSFERVFHL